MERRSGVRQHLIKDAEVLFGLTSLQAVALDLSDSGARMYFPAPADMPEVVVLRLPDGALRAARRTWRRDDESGFEFLTITPA
jgi:hypothetical protein